MKVRPISLAVFCVASLLWPGLAVGDGVICDRARIPEHKLDDALFEADEVPPEPIERIEVSITRAFEPNGDGCGGQSGSLCEDGGVELTLTPGFDQHTAPHAIGYLVQLADGVPPEGINLPVDRPIAPFSSRNSNEPVVAFHWQEGKLDTQKTVDFTLELHPIDAAGNVGESSLVRIFDPIDQQSCSTTPIRRGFDPTFAMLLAGLWVLRRVSRNDGQAG